MAGKAGLIAASGAVFALTVAAASAQTQHSRATVVMKYQGVWDSTFEYHGDYRNTMGDTVQYGEINGKKLYWWAKFYSKGDVPGMFAPEGGTSPWVLINSKAYDPANSSSKYVWKGWNGQLESSLSAGQAAVPTWRNGAEGAYTIIQDDIGAIPWETGIKPGYEISKNYPDIRTAWGVYVGDANKNDYWDMMREMVQAGHEMVCHSFEHTSAAEQWAWAGVGEKLPTSVEDPSIPKTLGGLTAVGIAPAAKNAADWAKAYTRITETTPLGTIEYTANWTGGSPAENIGETVDKEGTKITIEPIKVTPAAGVEKVTILGVDYYVKYTAKDTTNGVNEGQILATKIGWEDYDASTMDASFQADGGRAIWTMKAKCSDSWSDRSAFNHEITEATAEINAKVYDPIRTSTGFGQWFNAEKKCEYFVYPFDAYSEVTHDSIMNNNYVAARGGAKSGRPLPGDFFHPNRIDFDAFYMVDSMHTTLFPDNPHSIMTLKGMVDSCISQKGYMIRELHAICDVTGKDWRLVNDASQGGWWGGITTELYKLHMDYCQNLINQNKLVVYTPSEAVRYRMTANNVTGVNMAAAGNNWEVTCTTTPWTNGDNRWEDEISVIVKLASGVEKMDVTYKNGGHPYSKPRKISTDGTAWSINVNPYKGTAIIMPGADWTGSTITPVVEQKKAVASGISVRQMADRLSLSMPAGNYGIQLFNLKGQMVRSASVTTTGIASPASINLDGMATGMIIVRVKKDGQMVHTQSLIMK